MLKATRRTSLHAKRNPHITSTAQSLWLEAVSSISLAGDYRTISDSHTLLSNRHETNVSLAQNQTGCAVPPRWSGQSDYSKPSRSRLPPAGVDSHVFQHPAESRTRLDFTRFAPRNSQPRKDPSRAHAASHLLPPPKRLGDQADECVGEAGLHNSTRKLRHIDTLNF